MEILQNISLKPYNTFGMDATAASFAVFKTTDEAAELVELYQQSNTGKGQNMLVLGGGSNILFTQNFNGIVVKNEITGIEKTGEDEKHVYVKAGAGVNWHQLVMHSIENNWAGLENLSLIPGNAGASPMQNIGAYGVEIKDVFSQLEALDIEEKKIITFNAQDCEFGYRESVFKRRYKNQFIITSVTYRLNKIPVFNTSYGAIEQELEKMGVKQLSIRAVSQAVINIRSSKLPNPAEIGNAGSFFKNPEIPKEQYLRLKKSYPGVVGYDLANGNVKLAAGWLIEHSGPKENISWKGYREGDAGCHSRQALVLVNYGNADGKAIYSLSDKIVTSIKEKFGVVLEREVNIV